MLHLIGVFLTGMLGSMVRGSPAIPHPSEVSLMDVVAYVLPFPFRLPADPPVPRPGKWISIGGFFFPKFNWNESLGGVNVGGGVSRWNGGFRLDFAAHAYWGRYIRHWRRSVRGNYAVYATGLSGVLRGSWMSRKTEPVLEFGLGVGGVTQLTPLQNANGVYTLPVVPYGEVFVGMGITGQMWGRAWWNLGAWGMAITARFADALIVGGGMEGFEWMGGMGWTVRGGIWYLVSAEN